MCDAGDQELDRKEPNKEVVREKSTFKSYLLGFRKFGTFAVALVFLSLTTAFSFGLLIGPPSLVSSVLGLGFAFEQIGFLTLYLAGTYAVIRGFLGPFFNLTIGEDIPEVALVVLHYIIVLLATVGVFFVFVFDAYFKVPDNWVNYRFLLFAFVYMTLKLTILSFLRHIFIKVIIARANMVFLVALALLITFEAGTFRLEFLKSSPWALLHKSHAGFIS